MGSKEDRSGRMVGEGSHEGAQTVVRTTEGDSKEFNVKVGLHQDRVEENGNWPCGVCKKGVGNFVPWLQEMDS